MKKLTKTILSVAAVSAVTAAMAVSASAMSATYADGVVTLADVASSGASQTMIILNQDADVVETTMVEAIDQKDNDGVFETVPVNALADGTYYVRIGGTDGTLQEAEFTVGEIKPETETIIVGDVNFDGNANINDATWIAQKSVSINNDNNANVGTTKTVYSGVDAETIVVGDVNFDGNANINDATWVAQKSVSINNDNNANVGNSVEVVK